MYTFSKHRLGKCCGTGPVLIRRYASWHEITCVCRAATKEVAEKSGISPVAWKIPCCFNKQPTFASTAWPCFVAGTANGTNCGEVQESSKPRLCKWEQGFGFKQQFGRSLLHKKGYWSFVFKCFLNVSVLVPEAVKPKKWHLPPIKLAIVFCDLKNFDK